jgi:hypothetical protein
MEKSMADNMDNAEADRSTIDLSDQSDIHDWSRRLGVTELELQAAVEKVGPVAEDVRRFLVKT